MENKNLLSFKKKIGDHQPGRQQQYLPVNGGQLRYLLYLPPDFNTYDKWPVLCFLHGAGEAAVDRGTPQSLEVLFNHGSPAWHCAINSPLVHDFIVLAPQRSRRGPWNTNDLEGVKAILQNIYTVCRGDRQRTYLTGFSYGGKAVFDFARWDNNSWSALWSVDDSSHKPQSQCGTQRIWLHMGSWDHRRQNRILTRANLGLQEVEAFENGYPIDDRLYTDYSNYELAHTPTCSAAYSDWRVYKWLLN